MEFRYKNDINFSSKIVEPSALAPPCYRPFTREYSIHTTRDELLDNYRQNPFDKPPRYMPQAEDFLRYPTELKKLGPLDYSAQARGEYSHEEGFRGIRPVVNAYSISRYSMGEWRRKNQDLIVRSHNEQNQCDNAERHSSQCIENVAMLSDQTQKDNTERIWRREKEIFRWQSLLQDEIEKMADEIGLLQNERERLGNAMQIVLIPMSIASESINIRTRRMDSELVHDQVEDVLKTEMALTGQIKELLEDTKRKLELQMIENMSAKRQMQYDWAEKAKAFALESANGALRNHSQDILFKHGSIGSFPNDQSTVELWNKFVKDVYENAIAAREKSAKLRGTLDAILIHAARDLRVQADKVENALSNRIAETDEIVRQLEIELKKVMGKIADAESMFPKLKHSIQKLDYPMKVAQTRLDNKSIRPKVENCRDISQYGLINEVKILNESVSELRARLHGVEESHARLQVLRGDLERDVMLKKKTLQLDIWILNDVRSRFPSAVQLAGYIDVM